MGELAGGVSVAVAVGVSYRWNMTLDRWYLLHETWDITICNALNLIRNKQYVASSPNKSKKDFLQIIIYCPNIHIYIYFVTAQKKKSFYPLLQSFPVLSKTWNNKTKGLSYATLVTSVTVLGIRQFYFSSEVNFYIFLAEDEQKPKLVSAYPAKFLPKMKVFATVFKISWLKISSALIL